MVLLSYPLCVGLTAVKWNTEARLGTALAYSRRGEHGAAPLVVLRKITEVHQIQIGWCGLKLDTSSIGRIWTADIRSEE
jgi:hypothetical protein